MGGGSCVPPVRKGAYGWGTQSSRSELESNKDWLILSRMDVERARAFLLTLPHAVETMQWGDNLVFWVGDKAIGGKMFCLLNLDAGAHGVISYSAGPERYAELVEQEGIVPAPYMARIHWVAVERWSALRNAEWESELRAAHEITLAKLPKKTREALAMPERALAKLIVERRTLLAKRAEEKVAAKTTRGKP
jgi:predicted DNA-binding protein (MmcQ/YjbR family)